MLLWITVSNLFKKIDIIIFPLTSPLFASGAMPSSSATDYASASTYLSTAINELVTPSPMSTPRQYGLSSTSIQSAPSSELRPAHGRCPSSPPFSTSTFKAKQFSRDTPSPSSEGLQSPLSRLIFLPVLPE